MAEEDRQVTNLRHEAIAAKYRRTGFSGWKVLEIEFRGGEFRVADHLFNGPFAHQRNIAPGAIIAGEAKTVRVYGPAGMAQEMIMKEVQRLAIEHFLKAYDVGVSMGENGRRQAPVSQIQRGSLQPLVLRHVAVPGPVEPGMSHGMSETKVLHVESYDAHVSESGGFKVPALRARS